MKVKSVKKTNKVLPVYDIEVPKYHNFVIGRGAVVHNSIDATRYALNTYWKRKGN